MEIGSDGAEVRAGPQNGTFRLSTRPVEKIARATQLGPSPRRYPCMTTKNVTGTGLSLLLSLAGCGAPGGGNERAVTFDEDMTITTAPPDLLAFDERSDLVLADGSSGAVTRITPAGAAGDRDLAWDPWASRALLIQIGEDGEGGEIAAYPVTGAGSKADLGEREHLAWLDGRARILATPAGPVLFEESYGERWKLLGATPTASVIAPLPSSVWLEVEPGGAELSALTVSGADGSASIRVAAVGPSGIGAPTERPLGVPVSPSARLVPSRGGALLVDIAGQLIVARRVGPASIPIGPATALLPVAPGARIEAAITLGEDLVALLVSGSDEVVVLATGEDGAATGGWRIALPGAVRPTDRFASRDLAAQGVGRLLAATSAGVTAIGVSREGDITMTIEPGFDGAALRGPIAVLDPPP